MNSENLTQAVQAFLSNPQVQAFYQKQGTEVPTPEEFIKGMGQVVQPLPLTVVQWDNRDHKEIPTPKEYYL